MDTGDPWDWSVDRVVQELCTQDRSWQPYSSALVGPDPSTFAKALQEQLVTGSVLLMEVDDNAMKNDLGIKTLGHRAFVRSAIAELRVKSAQYVSYMETYHPQSAVASHHSRSLHEFGPQHAPAIEQLKYPELPLSPGESPAIGPSPTGEPTVDALGNKRRKLDVEDPSGLNTALFADDVYQDQSNAKDIPSEALNEASSSNHQPDAVTHLDINGKKRKRIAPTLVTSEIDPNRNRDVPTDADNVVQHNPKEITPEPEPAFEPGPEPVFESTPEPEAGTQVVPGTLFIGKDGRKRLAPILEFGTGLYEYANPDQITSEKALASMNETTRNQKTGSRSIAETTATGYLGKRKMCVDDIFYAGVEPGKELSLSSDEEDFCTGPSDISLGRRLYVNSLMRRFLRSEPQTFKRGDENFTAIIPYDPKLVPRFQKASFTLYTAPSAGQVHARREEIPSWPEVDPEADAEKPFPNIGAYSATFNPVGPDMLNGLGSYDEWDPSYLEKYHDLEGGDTVLPVYGESDEENEYDEETWLEIEAEMGHKLERPMRKLRNPPITDDEVNAALDRSIASFVAKWTETKLPKLQLKAFGLWNKSRKLKSYKSDISAAQNELAHLNERITALRNEILLETWTSETQVLRQATILEPTVIDREVRIWKLAVLQRKRSPEKPLHASPTRPKKSIVRNDEREGEGESLDSDSSSGDELDDFIVDDDPMDLAEAFEEEHELDLADGEGSEDDGTISDGSLSQPRAITPVKARKAIQTDSPAMSTSSSPPSSEIEGPFMTTLIDEEPDLPQHRSSTVSSVGNMIDLTMLSSDSSGPEIVDLSTPKKKKGKIALFSRNSPISSPIALDLEQAPDPKNLPALKNPAGIGKYSSQAWESILDRERLLISILFRMEAPLRSRIFDIISTQKESQLWFNMAQVNTACRYSNKGAKGLDTHTFDTLAIFVRLFEIYFDCISYPYRELPKASTIIKVEENQKAHFTSFFNFFKKLPGYFDPQPSSEPSPLPAEQKFGFSKDANDEDGEPVSSTRRRRSDASTTSDDDEEFLDENSPRKKQRKVFEDVDARNLREQDRLRVAEQEERRKNLQKKLASSDQHGVLNKGQIIVNDAKADDQGYIHVHPHISSRIKKHQIDGIRFMWNQIVGDEKVMQGCLLAHTMGLGKTMQVITLLVTIAEASASKDPTVSSQVPKPLRKSRTLVLCPPGLVGNWIDELLTWDPGNILGHFRQLNSSVRLQERLQHITQWYEDGGVLVVGYEMFRALIQNKATKSRGAALDEKVHARVKMELLEGPNIIIADEAHKLKNAKASITTVANQFKSSSRIALTGSPLANNVEEYHTMIDWVAPNYLGPAKEFRFKYVEPIELGLWQDSSSSERRKSLKMLGVLKEDIAPKVHRADMSVLRNDLPPKKEFVIKVPLTEVQRKAYSVYVNSMVSGSVALTKDGQIKQSTLWHWLAVLALLCNHPACFEEKLNERKGDATKEAARVEEIPISKEAAESGEEIEAALNEPIWKVGVSQKLIRDETSLFQAEGVDMKSIDLSYKVKITCQILDAAREVEDKVLVFSQSIPTLNFLEELFEKQGRKFMRLDGRTKMNARQALTKQFNTGDLEVYLISTTAGGLGLNLPGANRVIIFDFKFNPIQEEQAVGRAYRIGQKKPTFVYRFVAAGTFEDTVHNKTIYKMQLASRVVDKKNPIAHAKKNVSDFLFEPRDVEQQDLSKLQGTDPKVLDRILASQKKTRTIKAIVQSDTFELDDDDKLTAEEEKEVKQLLVDERLKRSNPQAYQALLVRRERAALRREQASNTVPNTTAINPGPHNHVVSSAPQSTPQRGLSTAHGPAIGVKAPTAPGANTATPGRPQLKMNPASTASNNGNATHAGIQLPGKVTPGLGSPKNPIPETRPSNQNAAIEASGAKDNLNNPKAISIASTPNKELEHGQLSERGRSPHRHMNSERTRSVVSDRSSQPAPPQNPRSRSTSRISTPESQDVQTLRSVLLEAAKKRDGFITEQTRQMAIKLSVQIDAAVKRYPHRMGDASVSDVSNALREDSKKCFALMNSKITANTFVREMLTSSGSTAEVEEDVGAKGNDITKTDMFAAMSRRPVPSSKTPVSKPIGSPTEKPFRNPRHDEDLLEVERVKEKRRARSSSWIPNWAQKDIDNAAKKEKEAASHASFTASPSR